MATGKESAVGKAAETARTDGTERPGKKRKLTPGAWAEARVLMRRYRYRLALGPDG